MGVYGLVELAGGAVVGYYLLKSIIWIATRLYCYQPFVKPVDFSALGQWSVVTGGTGYFRSFSLK